MRPERYAIFGELGRRAFSNSLGSGGRCRVLFIDGGSRLATALSDSCSGSLIWSAGGVGSGGYRLRLGQVGGDLLHGLLRGLLACHLRLRRGP